MKKILLPCMFLLAFCLSLPNASFAGANWWGDRCDEESNICLHIVNVKQNKMGFWSFLFTFYNKADGVEKALCEGAAPFEKEESHDAAAMFYNFDISKDGKTITVSPYPDTKIEEEGGCTKALFGTYKNQE